MRAISASVDLLSKTRQDLVSIAEKIEDLSNRVEQLSRSIQAKKC